MAHLHLAERAIAQFGLSRLDFTISTATLGKDDARLTPLAERVDELRHLIEGRPELAVRTTPHGLLADVAEGYDVVVIGADKWHQVLDPVWYHDREARDAALREMPLVAVAPRPPWPLPGQDPAAEPPAGVEVVVLATDPAHHPVSSTAVRAGRHEWRAVPDFATPRQQGTL